MEDKTNEKLEALMKYIPFIDFLLNIDKNKYVKFTNIKKWIVLKKKKYPLSDLNKIEQSIKTQYQNLLIENKVRIPKNISEIFAPLKFKDYVNLCSDDDDDKEENNANNHLTSRLLDRENSDRSHKKRTKRKSSTTSELKTEYRSKLKEKVPQDDSDDDIKIVSIDYIEKSKSRPNQSRKATITEDDALDDASKDLLSKIDKLAEDEQKRKMEYGPINYNYHQSDINDDSVTNNDSTTERILHKNPEATDDINTLDLLEESVKLFTRRSDFKNEGDSKIVLENVANRSQKSTETDVLFERRTDFKYDDEVVVESLIMNQDLKPYSKKHLETISLDSGSEDELLSDKPSTSKEAATASKDYQSNLKEITKPNFKEDDTSKNVVKNIENQIDIEKAESLCESIDSIFNENEINFDELLRTDDVKANDSSKITKENETQKLRKIYKTVLHDESIDTLVSALANANKNPETLSPSETPPPPPPINLSTTSPTNTSLHHQHNQMQITYSDTEKLPPFQNHSNLSQMQTTTVYNQTSNIINPQVLPPVKKINFKDPRIQKQLKVIKNFPLVSNNPEIEKSIMDICQSQAGQQVPNPPQSINNLPMYRQNVLSNKTANLNTSQNYEAKRFKSSTESVSTISYGEYKRRKMQQNLELEKQREEEKREELRLKILSYISPNKEEITSLWNHKKNGETNTETSITEQSNVHPKAHNEQGSQNKKENATECNKTKSNKHKKEKHTNEQGSQNKKENATECNRTKSNKHKKENSEDKLNRVYRELNCTVKGFDKLLDYVAKPVEDKRRSSIQARVNIKNQLKNDPAHSSSSSINNAMAKEKEYSHPIGLKRRCSIHALSAISEQLADSHLKDINIDSPQGPRESQSSEQIKRRKTIDEIIRPSKRCLSLRIESESESSSSSTEDANDSDDSEELQKLKKMIIKNPGYVKLERISQEFIRKHTKRKPMGNKQNRLNVHLVRLNDKPQNIQKPIEANTKKLNKPLKLNNDCQMTERNTHFCVLCTSKPSDLTNHYIRRHKTESYVSRLDWSEMDDLKINTPFAKLQPHTSNSRLERYAVECPFCKEELIDVFMNFYNHYSSHTGEFAFQCSHCQLLKPYRADIQSHLLHSKTCRNSYVQVRYRYPPDTQCIYLHYCDICNFVQLNEANIIKHIIEHHHSSKAIATNVGKCILAAISDGPDQNTGTSKILSPQPTVASAEIEENLDSTNTKTELKFKVDDDDVPISNEPCSEDLFEDNKLNLEEELKQMHEDTPNVQAPMTVIHHAEYLLKSLPECNQFHNPPLIASSSPHRHLKVEPLQINESILQAPSIASLNTNSLIQRDQSTVDQYESYTIYEKYRYYPETVNYLGLYKCMIDDCYYSTNCSEEMLKHLADHAIDSTTNEYLQCPYCIIPFNDISLTPDELIQHIRLKHQHMNYQCSVCCYRSLEASNVFIHQKSHHSTILNICKIYKCPINNEDNNIPERHIDLKQLIDKNVYKVKCRYCHTGFYNSNLLSKHISSEHKFTFTTSLKIYSCIYCPLTSDNMKKLRIHVASKHPEKIPYIYDHSGQVNKTEDALTSLNVINLSETVPTIEVASVVNQNVVETVLDDNVDTKPDVMQLQQMNEETIKVRLRKLTNHTGISLDTLYRCPISSCGGFFSIFDLWLKHMKLRHCALECECPHCPTTETTILPLENFRLHFEEHRQHTILCFYCTFSCSNEQSALQHANENHADFGRMRFEPIRFKINYSYLIMIQENLFTQREDFINEYLKILEKRLKNMETIEKQLLKNQWPLNNSSIWVENFTNLLMNHKTTLRCLIRNCDFRSTEQELFQHLQANHVIKDTMSYSCSMCNYRVEKCNSFEEIYNHFKIHSGSLFICAACSFHSSSRSRISLHIQQQHKARDVAVVQLFKMQDEIYNKICIVFANDHLTFSTMKNCFCCPEKNMDGNVFVLHLKRYHNLVLTYYCEKCKSFQFKSLEEVKEHFQLLHSQENIKLRCELAAKSDLSVLSLNEFQVEISRVVDQHKQNDKFLVNIKEEPYDPNDDCVILLEDNDVFIENTLKDENKVKEVPKIKCISLNNLIDTANKNNTLSSSQILAQTNQQQQQILKIPDHNYSTNQQHSMNLSLNANNMNSNNSILSAISALNTFNSVQTNSAANVTSTTTPYISIPASVGGNIVLPKPLIANNRSNFIVVHPNANRSVVSSQGVQPRQIIIPSNSIRPLGTHTVAHPNANNLVVSSQAVQPSTNNRTIIIQSNSVRPAITHNNNVINLSNFVTQTTNHHSLSTQVSHNSISNNK